MLRDGSGLIVSGPSFGIWSREKCCDRPLNRTSFHGLVNPLLYLTSWHQPGTWLGKMMTDAGGTFTADRLGRGVSIRIVPKAFSEVPADVISEIIRYTANQAYFEESLRERRRSFAIGTESCSHIFLGRLGGLSEAYDGFLPYAVDLLDKEKRLVAPHGRFVNIGANDGIMGDPLGTSLKKRHLTHALAIEMDRVNCKKHRRNLPHVHLACDVATPESIWDLVRSWTPLNSSVWRRDEASPKVRELPVDVLKIDIDSYDCAVAEELLHGGQLGRLFLRLKPSFVVLETNDGIPPPIKMSMRYQRSTSKVDVESWYCEGNTPLAGCSLSYQAAMMAKAGYGLVWVKTFNAVFAHNSLIPWLTEASGGLIRGPLDEIDCYANIQISTHCVGSRQIRRWFLEGTPVWKVLEEVTEHLKAIARDFNLPAMPLTLTL